MVGGGGMRNAPRLVSAYTASPGTSPYDGKSAVFNRPRKSSRSGDGFTTAPERRCEPACFPFSSTAIGTSPSRSRTSWCSSSSCPSLIAHASPPGPAPTIATPTSMRSSGGSVGPPTASIAPNGGVKSIGLATSAARAHELRELRDDLVQIPDDTDVAEVEDRRVRVLVDRDDRPRALHADLVLDRAGDPARDVEPWRHGLPRLADLGRVRIPTRVDDGARRTHGTTERRRELLEHGESLRGTETAAARDDDVRVLDRRPARLLLGLLDQGRERGEV